MKQPNSLPGTPTFEVIQTEIADEARDIPLCPSPQDRQRGPTGWSVPPGAVDCHAHVIGKPPQFPFVESRSYTPEEATEAAYLDMLDATGMTYGVLVQVSVHGNDNRLLCETLRNNRSRLRGIAVMPLGLPSHQYAAAKADGVVGLRLNVLYGGGIGFDQLENYAALAKEMGWHLQFLLDARQLPQMADRISRLQVPFVVDHMGHFPAELGVSSPGFQTLLALVRDGGWVKLSGAYRLDEYMPYEATVPLARALLSAAPARCVWGSDWPHVAHWKPMMGVGDLLDVLASWVDSTETLRRVLVSNPKQLYGF